MSTKKAFGCLPDLVVFILLSLFCALLFKASGATYYVATNGNDTTGDGSIGNPYLTLGTALIARTTAGTIIRIGPGTFPERPDTKASGTAANPITIVGSGTNSTILGGLNLRHAYIHLLNCQLSGAGTAAFDGVVKFGRTSHYCLVSSNYFFNCPTNRKNIMVTDPSTGTNNLTTATNWIISYNGITGPNYTAVDLYGYNGQFFRNSIWNVTNQDCITLWGVNQSIVSNTFYNILSTDGSHVDLVQTFGTGGYYEAHDITFAHNYAYDSDCQLGNLTTSTNSSHIYNWTFYNNVYTKVGQAFNIYVSNTVFYNNTFYLCTTGLAPVLQFKWSDTYATHGRAYNGKVYNNIFVNCGSTPTTDQNGYYWQETNALNLTADYNFITGTNGIAKAVTEAHGVNSGDVKFVSVYTNLHITNGSLAIAKGTNLSSLFAVDFDNVTRSNNWDMGAYQYIYTAPTNSAVLRPRQPEKSSWILNRLYHLIGRNHKPRKRYAKKTAPAARCINFA